MRTVRASLAVVFASALFAMLVTKAITLLAFATTTIAARTSREVRHWDASTWIVSFASIVMMRSGTDDRASVPLPCGFFGVVAPKISKT
jgi:hypothetical protein